MFTNVDGDNLLGIRMEEPKHRDGQRLSSKNSKHRMQYIEHLQKHLEAHNVQRRIGTLGGPCSDRQFTEEETKVYEKIDKCIMDGMRAAEYHLSQKREQGWTAEIQTLIQCIR